MGCAPLEKIANEPNPSHKFLIAYSQGFGVRVRFMVRFHLNSALGWFAHSLLIKFCHLQES